MRRRVRMLWRHRPWVVLVISLGCLGMGATDPEPDWPALLEQRDADGLKELATRYENADGVRRDYARARQLYCAAARLGQVAAQIRLAWMYTYGVGTPQDRDLAGAWLRVAAATGDRTARNFLAYLDYPPRGRQPQCSYETRFDRYAIATTIAPGDHAIAYWPLGADPEHGGKDPSRQQVESWVRELAPRYGLDAGLVLAMIQVESNFNPRARSHRNAIGLMQLIPDTAARFGVRDITHPVQNLHGGMAYLRWLLAYFQGDLRLALAGYNAGEGAVEKYLGIPPYAETRNYVRKVLRAYGRTSHPRVEQVVEPSRILRASLQPSPRR